MLILAYGTYTSLCCYIPAWITQAVILSIIHLYDATGNTPVCGWGFELADDIAIHLLPKKTFLQYFLVILKRTLQITRKYWRNVSSCSVICYRNYLQLVGAFFSTKRLSLNVKSWRFEGVITTYITERMVQVNMSEANASEYLDNLERMSLSNDCGWVNSKITV